MSASLQKIFDINMRRILQIVIQRMLFWSQMPLVPTVRLFLHEFILPTSADVIVLCAGK